MADTSEWDSVATLLSQARAQLVRGAIPSPQGEARLLLAECLGVSLAWVLAHPESEVPPDRRLQYLSWIDRRETHEPVAYIVGRKGFLGLDFEVTPAVLIPRPETELLVERALAAADRLLRAKSRTLVAADLGTGCGAIAVALAARQPMLRVVATDRSDAALAVARANAAKHGVADRIDFRSGDLLEPVHEHIDLLVANLPYIPSAEIDSLMPDVALFEPREALDGGPDGMLSTRRALEKARGRMDPPAALLFEIGEAQGQALSEFARGIYPEATVTVFKDYAGIDRILSVEVA